MVRLFEERVNETTELNKNLREKKDASHGLFNISSHTIFIVI